MTAMRAILAAVADLLRAGRVPIAREQVIVNLDTTPVQLHTTTFHTGDPTGARNLSYLDRIHMIRLFTIGRATLSFSLVLVWVDGVARIAGSSRIACTARSGGRGHRGGRLFRDRVQFCSGLVDCESCRGIRGAYSSVWCWRSWAQPAKGRVPSGQSD